MPFEVFLEPLWNIFGIFPSSVTDCHICFILFYFFGSFDISAGSNIFGQHVILNNVTLGIPDNQFSIFIVFDIFVDSFDSLLLQCLVVCLL